MLNKKDDLRSCITCKIKIFDNTKSFDEVMNFEARNFFVDKVSKQKYF